MVCGSCHAIGLLLVLTDEPVGPFDLQLGLIQDSGGFCQIVSVYPEGFARRFVKAQEPKRVSHRLTLFLFSSRFLFGSSGLSSPSNNGILKLRFGAKLFQRIAQP